MNTTYAALLLLLAGCTQVEETPAPSDSDTGEAAAESEVGSPNVAVYGSLGDIFSKGDYGAKVGLDEIGGGSGLIAFGRLSDLRGEIAILEGQIWLALAQEGGVQV